jgi:hypothetical protein
MSGQTFQVIRDVDHSGISGTGLVAEGWESSDGKTVVIVWLSATPSVCIYSDIRHVEAIHGHGGDTRIVYDDGATVVRFLDEQTTERVLP